MTSQDNTPAPSYDAVCTCGHTGYWHSHSRRGNCEYNGECSCRVFTLTDAPPPVGIVVSRRVAQALYDHTGTMPFAPGSWTHEVRDALSDALAVTPSQPYPDAKGGAA